MSQSRRFLMRMILFLMLVAGLAALLRRSLADAFMGNPAVNGVILGILIAGIIYIFRQVVLLDPEIDRYGLASLLTSALEGALMQSQLFDDAVHMERVVDHLVRYIESLPAPASTTPARRGTR